MLHGEQTRLHIGRQVPFSCGNLLYGIGSSRQGGLGRARRSALRDHGFADVARRKGRSADDDGVVGLVGDGEDATVKACVAERGYQLAFRVPFLDGDASANDALVHEHGLIAFDAVAGGVFQVTAALHLGSVLREANERDAVALVVAFRRLALGDDQRAERNGRRSFRVSVQVVARDQVGEGFLPRVERLVRKGDARCAGGVGSQDPRAIRRARSGGFGCGAVVPVVIGVGELRVGECGIALRRVFARFGIDFHHRRPEVARQRRIGHRDDSGGACGDGHLPLLGVERMSARCDELSDEVGSGCDLACPGVPGGIGGDARHLVSRALLVYAEHSAFK